MEKQCVTCKQSYPVGDYYTIYTKRANGTVREYTYKYCKYCHYEKMKPTRKKWEKENPERLTELINQAVKRWRHKQPAGVYIIQTNKGMYIGESDHIPFRITQHKSSKQFGVVKTKGAKILSWHVLETIEDVDKRRKREKYWIKKLQPELNIYNK